MTLVKTIIAATAFPLMLLSQTHTIPVSHTLKGTIINKQTGKPLPNVYVYVVKGEEEALTNNNGSFNLVTWQKLPVTLHIQHNEGENLRLVVANPIHELTIKL